ncbi:MAG: EAL domain-containing protein [Acidimicrobiales bacterium]
MSFRSSSIAARPTPPPPADPRPAGAEADGFTAQARIVVVDDEPTNVLVLTRMLERAGYRHVVSFTDARNALRELDRLEPDLVLLDLHMPVIDGVTFLTELDRQLDDRTYLPVLVVTADVTDQARTAALTRGAHDFLTKPFNYTELLLRIQNLLRTRFQHVALERERCALEARVGDIEHAANARLEQQRRLTRQIEQIIESRSVAIVFQPIVDLTTACIVGAEALARFTPTPVRPPEEWFEDARSVGLLTHLELAAISTAIDHAAALPGDAFLAVNASPTTLRSPRLLEELRRFDPTRVVIEVCDQDESGDHESLRDAARRAKQLGARVAVDNTGDGAAGLERIVAIEPDLVKLERELIADIHHSPVKRALVNALVHFCNETGATLIAEGIERVEELYTLRSLGVRTGQGYFLGRPAPLPLNPPTMRQLWLEP